MADQPTNGNGSNGDLKLWLRSKLDQLFNQAPAFLLALAFIAVFLGWIPSPVLSMVKEMDAAHARMVETLQAICLNLADNDAVKLSRCMR